MSLVFAAIAPHPPILIPTIGQEALKKIDRTKQALEKLEEELYLAKPDTVIIISPHGHIFPDTFCLNLSPSFITDLRDFGDLATRVAFRGEVNLPGSLRSATKRAAYGAVIISEEKLDHGVAVPLLYLARHLQNVKILPIGYSDLDAKSHLEFGHVMKDLIMKTNRRVAVIASGDLSHALTTDAPAGFQAAGAEFDRRVQELLSAHNTAGLLQLDHKLIQEAAECGLRSILILMGVLQGINYRYEAYAYEGPFGVGYLTANFIL